ncbi:MAG: MoaD/ThiS family protein [Isosphaeraceae bacterium]|nr:MoaD/ThiS family protein [Isosphaeraceae bacterium]
MRIRLRLFAIAKERAGRPTIELEVPDHGTISDLKRALSEAVPGLDPVIDRIRFAIGTDYADDDTPIPPNADVAAIPPVSGG